jgi:phage baseplate assembly protein W
MSFQANPLNDDLIALKNENAIARSIRNIVFTLPGEKFFNPSFGSRITESLFENIDDITATVIVDEIRESIETYEDRVQLDSVEAFPNFENNSFDVTITYEIIGRNVPAQELQFVLQSSR